MASSFTQNIIPSLQQYGSNNSRSSSSSGGDYSQVIEKEEGWDLEFVPRRDEKHDCPICLLVLREPMQTECGHRFCKACILKWFRESEARCPVDNQPLEERQLFPDNFAKREILALTVKCPNNAKGCDQTIVLKHLQTHLDNCVYSFIPCPNECASILMRGDLSEHLQNQCTKRITKCSLCQLDVVAESLSEHCLTSCPMSVISCPHCSSQLPRQQLSHHLNVECQKTVIRCPYHLLGCTFQGTRQEMQVHELSLIADHLRLINNNLIWLFSVLRINPPQSQTESSNAGSVSRSETTSVSYIDPSDRLSMLHHLFQHLNIQPPYAAHIPGVSIRENLSMPVQQVPSNLALGSSVGFVRTFNSVPVTIVQQQTPIITPVHDTPVLTPAASPTETSETDQPSDAERTSSNQTGIREVSYSSNPTFRFDHEMPKLSSNDSQFHSIKCQNDIQDESLARHDQQLMELTHQYDYQEKVIRDLKVKIKTLENTIQDFEGRGGNGIYVWKIRNFVKLRREAEKGETTAIHSASFYSSFYGYKLCIRVNLNGVDSARGTHLSLFIHFMQGEYDDLLEWPFNGRIILTIIDQNPVCEMRNHISETLMSKPNLAAFQKPVSTRNHKGFGYMEFLPLSVIDNSTYVRNDTLLIKANVIPVNS